MPNSTIADNGNESLASILAEMGESPDLIGLPPDSGAVPTEGDNPTQRDSKGRFTKTETEETDELPGILKDAEKDEEGLPSDDEIEDLVKGLPKDEAERARKGVQKLVNRAKNHETKVREDAEMLERMRSWEQALSNPETAEDALAQLTGMVRRITGKQATTPQPQVVVGKAPNPNDFIVDGECDWHAWSEAVAEHATQKAEAKLRVQLQGELEPLKGFVSESQAERQARQKAEGAIPVLQGLYGTELATPERVRQAVAKYPVLPVEDAFAATHVKEIARHFAAKGKNQRAPKREMIGDQTLATRESTPKPGAFHTMDSILEELSVE